MKIGTFWMQNLAMADAEQSGMMFTVLLSTETPNIR